jgi:ribosomal protein S18 acetylase RimI-like enzyme
LFAIIDLPLLDKPTPVSKPLTTALYPSPRLYIKTEVSKTRTSSIYAALNMFHVVVGLAEVADIPSIGTLHARAYHPTREWHRRIFPESIAPWWEKKYAMDIADSNSYVLKFSSPDLLSLRKYDANETGAGRWASCHPPPEVDKEAYDAMIKSMVEYRERFMLGRVHLCIDHFGVDHEYQGRGMGKMLIAKACEIADREQLDVFVQANEFAESFYHNFGFGTEGRLEMPLDGVTQGFLVRKSR